MLKVKPLNLETHSKCPELDFLRCRPTIRLNNYLIFRLYITTHFNTECHHGHISHTYAHSPARPASAKSATRWRQNVATRFYCSLVMLVSFQRARWWQCITAVSTSRSLPYWTTRWTSSWWALSSRSVFTRAPGAGGDSLNVWVLAGTRAAWGRRPGA